MLQAPSFVAPRSWAETTYASEHIWVTKSRQPRSSYCHWQAARSRQWRLPRDQKSQRIAPFPPSRGHVSSPPPMPKCYREEQGNPQLSKSLSNFIQVRQYFLKRKLTLYYQTRSVKLASQHPSRVPWTGGGHADQKETPTPYGDCREESVSKGPLDTGSQHRETLF